MTFFMQMHYSVVHEDVYLAQGYVPGEAEHAAALEGFTETVPLESGMMEGLVFDQLQYIGVDDEDMLWQVRVSGPNADQAFAVLAAEGSYPIWKEGDNDNAQA